jgi:hypothetical protein
MADAARRLISASRPLQAADLTLDQLAASDGIDAADLQQRADTAVSACAARQRRSMTRSPRSLQHSSTHSA